MAKEQFREELHLSKQNVIRLDEINSIIDEYASDGYVLTLRQLYYQLVSRDIIPNKTSEYSKLSTILVKGRMAGVVDWDAIEDRIRVPYLPYSCDDVPDAMNDLINQYRLNRQEGQETYIELWVEKDALSGVLKRVTREYHIRLMVNRGYSSCTAIHDAYERFDSVGYPCSRKVILYLGDHDPSGLDMIRDIQERLDEFGADVEVIPIGLTMKQIEKYNPPPNPAKITDPRAKSYIQEYGGVSWEVDALNPKTLNTLVKKNIEKLIDINLFNEQLEQEERDKEELQGYVEQ